MKIGVLKAVGHNLADSIACGMGFMVGVYEMDIFREAGATPEGYIEVDFLTGDTSGGKPSASLAQGLKLYSEDALPSLLGSHGASLSDVRELKVRFWPSTMFGRFEVTVENKSGSRAKTEYEGLPAHRIKTLDKLGRVRSL